MGSRKKLFIAIIVGIVICCAGVYLFLQKYYFYNKYNVHERKLIMDRLNKMYGQEFELLSIEFETEEIETGKYAHMWTFTLRDDQGREFCTFDRSYGTSEKEGAFYHPDYYSFDYIDDTYGQICLEERLGDRFNLQKYRQEKGGILPCQKDYIFVCTKGDEDEIAEILTEIYFAEAEFSSGGCLRCLVNDGKGEEMFSYHWWTVTRKLQQQQQKEITRQTVYEYILQELQGFSA